MFDFCSSSIRSNLWGRSYQVSDWNHCAEGILYLFWTELHGKQLPSQDFHKNLRDGFLGTYQVRSTNSRGSRPTKGERGVCCRRWNMDELGEHKEFVVTCSRHGSSARWDARHHSNLYRLFGLRLQAVDLPRKRRDAGAGTEETRDSTIPQRAQQ